MNESEVFIVADRALLEVVEKIRSEQWTLALPPTFFVRKMSGENPTLRDLVAQHAYDDAWVPDLLAGRTMAEVGAGRFQGDLLGSNPRTSFAQIVQKACEAVSAVTDMDRVVHCSFGDFPVREYLCQLNGWRALRAYEMGELVGVDAALPEDLWGALWEEFQPRAELWRSRGVFPPEIPVPTAAPVSQRVLGLAGRSVDMAEVCRSVVAATPVISTRPLKEFASHQELSDDRSPRLL